MPYTNSKSTPKYIYRVDRRPPELIFSHGFTSWGNNNNFFRHILGHSLRRDLPIEERSIFISASDSPDSAIRFFGSLLYNPHESQIAYLYEIRANDNVYSALRTASNYLGRIRNRSLIFDDGDYVVANEAIDAIFNDFAFQREWFNVGYIEPARIRSAFRIDSVPINPDHINHQRDTVYFTPRINEPEILNTNYVDDQTQANFLPYSHDTDIMTPTRVSIPETIIEADSSGAVASSMGFACNLDTADNVFLNHRDKRSVELSPYGHCYADKALVNRALRNRRDVGPYLFSKRFYSLVYLMGLETKKDFLLGWESIEKKYSAVVVDENKQNLASQFIYDDLQRISLGVSDDNIAYCLTIVPTYSAEIYEVQFKIATVNDVDQKWEFEPIINKDHLDLFRINSQSLKNFSIYRKKDDLLNKLYLLNNKKPHDGYEELYIHIDKNKSDSCILLPQKASTQLVDIQLCWYYSNQYYCPVPETGFSRAKLPDEKTIFYDLNTYKIIYINKKHEIFALYNKRISPSSRWDWVRWKRSDLKKTNDDREKWYFEIQKWKSNFDDMNFRNIRSFENNDWLRVILSGSNWGSFYTTSSKNDFNSIAVFVISSDANV